MSTAGEILALEAEVTFYRDQVALLRARLYRRGLGSSDRLKELQRRLDSARLRLTQARSAGARRT